MKPYISYSLLAAAAACGMASAAETAYTTPVGYTTKNLAANQFTLVGLTVHSPTVSAGILTGESATSVTVAGVDFVALLGTPSPLSATPLTYILELTDGTVQEIKDWTALGVLTTPDNITALVVPGTTTYKLRKAATVSNVFGANNSVGLTPDTDGSLTGTDYVLILNAAGTAFTTVYYFNDGSNDPEVVGWYDLQSNRVDNKAVPYPDSLFVQRAAGSPLSLVVSGEVKTVKTGGVILPGYNYVNSVAPAGSTLGNSGLQAFVTPDTDGSLTNIDYVLVQQGVAYKSCYYFNDGSNDPEVVGWYDLQSNRVESLSLDGGFLLQSASGPKPYSVSVPSTYSNL